MPKNTVGPARYSIGLLREAK